MMVRGNGSASVVRAMQLAILFAIFIASGLCQNAERHFHDFRNFHADTELDRPRDAFWDAAPEGAPRQDTSETRRGIESAALQRKPAELQFSTYNATGHRSSHSSPSPRQPEERKKHRRGRQSWRDRIDPVTKENLVNIGGRNRGKKKANDSLTSLSSSYNSNSKKSRSRGGRFREERRRRRRNRKRSRGRLRLESRREESKYRNDSPTAKLLKILKEKVASEANYLSENPLNLSSPSFHENGGSTRFLEPSNLTSPSIFSSQLTTEPRIPEPPAPTSHYRTYPSEVEREFSRHLEREYEKSVAEEENNEDVDEDDEEEEEEEMPKFDERYLQATKQQELNNPYDPERMLGYSRTDEDLPILDMENEVLQRTMKDYNAYMSSSTGKISSVNANREDDSSSSHLDTFETEGEEDPRGDLSCINGTFLPAPFVHHAVIKYVKSSKPGHEYLEADYECEPGYILTNNLSGSNRLLCRNRRWIGRLPSCRYHGADEATCTELGCEHFCKIVEGRAECLCREGFRREERSCIDINECESNNDRGPCQDTCLNHPGTFSCSCDNLPGTRLSSDNRTCLQEAVSDECSYNNAGCSHTCLASMGRVFCLCPDGFMLEDDWKTCQDVNECAVPDLQTEICKYGCINTPGSYHCAPAPHEIMQGSPLLRRLGVECQSGYQFSSTKTCVDIDECATNNGGCSEVCENTEGSYFCACEGDERILSANRRTCIVAEKRFESMDREASLSLRMRSGGITCSPLKPAGGGYLMCSDDEETQSPTASSSNSSEEDNDENENDEKKDEEKRKKKNEDRERNPIRPGTKCHLKCPHGYELHGEYELTCRADGTWDGPKHGECLRYSKPRLDCPKDVVAELPPGRDEAFVTYEQPSTDLDWFRYVHSKPSWGTRLEANLKLGLHEITFYARHPVSKKQASCTLKINVEEGQAPKVKDCPSDIEVTGKNGSAITWAEPIFTDNVKVTRITSTQSPGQVFTTGGHKVEYEATDEAGWTTKCIFTVVLRPLPK